MGTNQLYDICEKNLLCFAVYKMFLCYFDKCVLIASVKWW